MIINLEEIKKLIPHRDPFLFVDKCTILDPGKKGSSERYFSEDEYFFKEKFAYEKLKNTLKILKFMFFLTALSCPNSHRRIHVTKCGL